VRRELLDRDLLRLRAWRELSADIHSGWGAPCRDERSQAKAGSHDMPSYHGTTRRDVLAVIRRLNHVPILEQTTDPAARFCAEFARSLRHSSASREYTVVKPDRDTRRARAIACSWAGTAGYADQSHYSYRRIDSAPVGHARSESMSAIDGL
jgi:hypothetical protein